MLQRRTALALIPFACSALTLASSDAVAAPPLPFAGYGPNQQAMQDVEIGPDGDIFALAYGSQGGDGGLYHWVHGEWQAFGGSGSRVAVDSRGRPWTIDVQGLVRRFRDGWWQTIGGVTAKAIDIGFDGNADHVMIVRADDSIAVWNGSSFQSIGVWGLDVAVGNDGNPWVVDHQGGIWQHTGQGWLNHPYIGAEAIDVGGDGTVYALAGGSPHELDPAQGTWEPLPSLADVVSVSPTGIPIVIDAGALFGLFFTRLHGDASCSSTADDCNVCAYDVRGQFRAMFEFGHRDNISETWDLNWDQIYGPDGVDPTDAFDDGGSPPSSKHVQGFVRTGSPSFPFAGSYSDDTLGSMFVIRDFQPDDRLTYIHRYIGAHPSGVHALGHWVGVNERGDVKLERVDDPNAEVEYDTSELYEATMKRSGGGFGLARLRDGRVLVTSTDPGGPRWDGGDDGPRSTHFFAIDGPLDDPSSATFSHLGGGEHIVPWGDHHQNNENVSLITECETGQIYAVHTTGDNDIYGDGFWRISRVEVSATGPILRALDYYTEGQNMHTCYLRAAATAYALDNHVIETYCHEYDARDDGDPWEGVDYTRRPGDYAGSCILTCGYQSNEGCWCDDLCHGYGDCCNDRDAHCGD